MFILGAVSCFDMILVIFFLIFFFKKIKFISYIDLCTSLLSGF